MQSLKYLSSGPLSKHFADPSFVTLSYLILITLPYEVSNILSFLQMNKGLEASRSKPKASQLEKEADLVLTPRLTVLKRPTPRLSPLYWSHGNRIGFYKAKPSV